MNTRNFKTSDREVLQTLVDHPHPALKSSEIQEMLDSDVSTNAVNYRLNKLKKRGAVDSKSFGSSAKGWWITDEGRKLLWELKSQSDTGDGADDGSDSSTAQ